MSTKIFNIIFGCSVVVGAFLLLGTAGASDLNKMDFDTILFQSLLSLSLVLIGVVGLKINNRNKID
jgi:hypothetical protein